MRDWVDKAFNDGVKESLLQALRKGAVMGEGTAGLTKKALQVALDDGFTLTKRDAITLVRTYTQTANVEAQKAVYKANDDIIYAFRWCSILDTSVCPRCGALDGVVYKKGEKMPPTPLHPRCRCLIQPLMRIDELNISSEDLERVARPWGRRELKNIDEGGRRKLIEAGTTKENFSGWWKTLPENEQQYSMGPLRTRLLREGKISFGDLVEKSTGRLRTLEELGFTESGKALPQVFGMLPNPKENFIEKLTGASGEVPRSLTRLVSQINPNYNPAISNEYSRNCQRCYVAFELAARGHNIEALGNPYLDRSGTSKRPFFVGWECFKDPEIIGSLSPQSQTFINEKTLLKNLENLPDESRIGIICPLNNDTSHAVICIRANLF